MKHFNKFWVYALVLSIFIALIVWRMQHQVPVDAPADGSGAASTPSEPSPQPE